MGRSIQLQSAMAGGVLLLAGGGLSAEAGELVTCQPTAANVADVSVNNLRMGMESTYFWATARVRLKMRDGSNREYALNGRADPIGKQLPPNHAAPGFAYPGFACTVRHTAIASVRNCRGGNKRRTCEIGVQMFGVSTAYSVSLTAERLIKVRQASAVP
jgi:hypothetical protein